MHPDIGVVVELRDRWGGSDFFGKTLLILNFDACFLVKSRICSNVVRDIKIVETAVDRYQGHLLDSRYLVEELIGRGGMGVVYRGRHAVVGRPVAIKFLSAEFSKQSEVVTRFYREAQTAAAIGHKNIVDILDVGISPHNQPYFVMEYLEGESLAALIARRGPLSLSAACGILEPVLLAMSTAHAKGIVHRDLKPDNVFLVQDPADNSVLIKLIDFGISKFLHLKENDKLTRAGSALGTPVYMSPEQVSCSFEVDHRSDIYTIGVLFYEMLTGDTPHAAGGNQETMLRILTEAPRDPRAVNRDFPEAARPLIERSIAANPNHRYQTAAEMLLDLKCLEAFSTRHEALAEASLGRSGSFAVGDLGRPVGDDENLDTPRRVWSAFAAQYTTTEHSSSAEKTSGIGNKGKAILGASAAAVAAALLVFVFLSVHQENLEPRNISAPAVLEKSIASPVPEASREVRIEIIGAPSPSIITFDGVLVPSSSFYIPRSNRSTRLTVEAEGFLPFHSDLVPDKDVRVQVEMDVRPDPISVQADRPSKEYLKGRRQTEIAKDFE